MKIGIIVRADNTGLGNQTYELTKMLNPERVMIIDFTFYNGNAQHFDWYDGIDSVILDHIPTDKDIADFARGLDIIISCETFYNKSTPAIARDVGAITCLQYNFELFGSLKDKGILLPDILLSPSSWYFNYVQRKLRLETFTIHLPPPTRPEMFKEARDINMSKDHKRILHIAGRLAAKDRNGTLDVIEMLKYSKADYELVIYSQFDVEFPYCDDPRLTIIKGDVKDREDMYEGFDAMVLPRRYAGLSLPMNEALMSGLPVFMTDISPNNEILPSSWLIASDEIDLLRLKVSVPVYKVKSKVLAERIDEYINSDNKYVQKEKAFNIGYKNFSPEILKPKYLKLFGQ
jgi:glycosyltransferase involved in cell wall biosynthesis